jgi:hypothetical protein
MKQTLKTNHGLIGLLIVLITGIVILAYLGITYSDIEHSSEFQAVWSLIKGIWTTYIMPGISFLWNHIVAPAFIKFFGSEATSTAAQI